MGFPMMRSALCLLLIAVLFAACGPGAIEGQGSGGAGAGVTGTGGAARVIPTATSATLPAGYDLVADLDALPFRFPCQQELVGREARGDAAYVPGPYPKLIGCITDRQGNGIRNASVIASPEDPTTMLTSDDWGPSEADGRYLTPGIVKPGWYEAEGEARGYKPATKRVWVDATRTTVVNFVLEPKE